MTPDEYLALSPTKLQGMITTLHAEEEDDLRLYRARPPRTWADTQTYVAKFTARRERVNAFYVLLARAYVASIPAEFITSTIEVLVRTEHLS